MAEHRLYFKPNAWYEQNNINLMLGMRAENIDVDGPIIHLSDGSLLPFDKLVIATGAWYAPALPRNSSKNWYIKTGALHLQRPAPRDCMT